jgi:hypothetical protein
MTDTALIDATQKELAYRGLGSQYVEQGNAWLALHAFASADLHAALRVLASNGYDAAPFLQATSEAFPSIANRFEDGMNPFQALVTSRTRMLLCLPEELRGEWHHSLGMADIFEGQDILSLDRLNDMVRDHLDGRTVEEFIDWAYTESYRLAAAAARKRAAGDEWGAVVDSYAADLAAFEAWLFERSLSIGDTTFSQAEMRWALAVAALENISALPEDATDASFLVRSRLAWALGPVDAEAFADRVEERLAQ